MKVKQQLSLFHDPAEIACNGVLSSIMKAMKLGAALAISISGGKDSDAMLRYLVAMHRAEGWRGQLFAITADLGRIEWPGTLLHIRQVCAELSVPLVVVRREKGGMIERWDERRQTLLKQAEDSEAETEGTKPFWSSSSARYCTKELKTAVVDKYLRRFRSVVCAIGIRADESSSRATKPRVQVRNGISTAALKAGKGLDATAHESWADVAVNSWAVGDRVGRLALTWNAVFDWSIEDVWHEIGTSTVELKDRRRLYQSGRLTSALKGWPAHWAYVSGNSRLSCSLCVLASAADIRNGCRHNLATLLELSLMEQRSGWSFQQGKWLSNQAAAAAGEIDSMTDLHEALLSLQLLIPWKGLLLTCLLRRLPVSVLVFWQSTALKTVARLVEQAATKKVTEV